MFAIALELARRGHHASLACPPSFEPWARSYGVEHHELGEDLQSKLADASTAPEQSIRGMTRYFTEQMALQAPRLLELARDADVIVGTGMAWMSASVAEKLGIPVLCFMPGTAAVRSRLYPPPLMPWFGLPSWMNGLLWWAYERSTNALMGAPVNGARAGLGLPPIAAFDAHLFVDTPCVVGADELVMPPDPLWQGRYPYVGFVFLDDPAPLDPALDAWLSSGEPPIFVGFGSMAGSAPERVLALLVDALRGSGRRCLVLGGTSLFGDRPPEGFFAVREAPFARLFPRVAAVVHHGGSGTMALALRAGVPQVVLPMMLDQHFHAHCLVRAGLAPLAPTMAKATAKSLASALDRALALPPEPRRLVAERLATSQAARAIVDRLEHMTGART